jgi:toxin HigB-1
MIKSFKCPDTEKLYAGVRIGCFAAFSAAAMRKLAMLNRAERLEDLRIPPGNRLESLQGDRAGQYSIRINAQWRVCFEWRAGHVWNVEIVDYH